MIEEERVKAGEGTAKQVIQVQTGDIEVAKLQLASRWAETATGAEGLEELLKAFARAYKAIDETLRM